MLVDTLGLACYFGSSLYLLLQILWQFLLKMFFSKKHSNIVGLGPKQTKF